MEEEVARKNQYHVSQNSIVEYQNRPIETYDYLVSRNSPALVAHYLVHHYDTDNDRMITAATNDNDVDRNATKMTMSSHYTDIVYRGRNNLFCGVGRYRNNFHDGIYHFGVPDIYRRFGVSDISRFGIHDHHDCRCHVSGIFPDHGLCRRRSIHFVAVVVAGRCYS